MRRSRWQISKGFAVLLLAGHSMIGGQAAEPFEQPAISFESGMLWQVGANTPLDYQLVPNQLVWRSGEVFGWSLEDGSRVAVRTRVAGLAAWVVEGPESYYLGGNASPSIEWWSASRRWSLYLGAGGGVGWVDAQAVEGGQGQDFTLNWFARAGCEWIVSDRATISIGGMFLHLSNGGRTHPNPGIDALGLTLAMSWRY